MHLEHLDIESLVSLQFGEVEANRARRMRQHLAACAGCRAALDRVQRSMDAAADPEPETADPGTLLARIRDWETGVPRAGRQGETLKRRIALELAPYLGQTGADTLLRPVQDDGCDLFSKVAPLLSMFLGRRAAGNIVTRVVEKTIVGMGVLCES